MISLNGIWKITTDLPTDFWKNETDISSWKDIPVPAQASMQGVRLQLNKEYAYKTKITIPKNFKDKRILIRFEGGSGSAKAYINGHFLREHFGGYNIWLCNITEFVQAGTDAMLTVSIVDPPANKSSSGMSAVVFYAM